MNKEPPAGRLVPSFFNKWHNMHILEVAVQGSDTTMLKVVLMLVTQKYFTKQQKCSTHKPGKMIPIGVW